MILEEVILSHREAEKAAEEIAKSNQADFIQGARERVRAVFGAALFDELAPHITETCIRNNTYYMQFEPIALKLAPFLIGADRVSVKFEGVYLSGNGNLAKEIPQLLARQRDGFAKWYEDDTRKKTEKLTLKLMQASQTPPADAGKIYEALCASYPDKKEEWADRYRDYLAYRKNMAEWAAQEAAYQEDQNKLAADYKTAFQTYWDEVNRIFNENKAAAEALQEKLNTPYTVYELTYSTGPTDEDAEGIETQEMYVMEPEGVWNGHGAWFTKVNYGRLQKTKVFWPVSLITLPVEPKIGHQTATRSTCPGVSLRRVSGGVPGVTVYAVPGTTVEPWWQDCPAEPEVPDGLSYHQAVNIVEHIINKNEEPTEIPF